MWMINIDRYLSKENMDADFWKTIRDRLRSFKTLYESNLKALEVQLVTPVINKIGWNMYDPNEVEPLACSLARKYSFYKLLTPTEAVFLVIADMSIDVTSDSFLRELKTVVREEIDNSCFTFLACNGYIWCLGKAEENNHSLILVLDMEDPEIEYMVFLEKLGEEQLFLINRLERYLDIVFCSFEWEYVKSEILFKVFEKIDSDTSYSFDEFELFNKLTYKRIAWYKKLLAFPISEDLNGSKYEVKIGPFKSEVSNVKDVIVEVVKWLYERKKIDFFLIPLPVSPSRYLLNSRPIHRYGIPFSRVVTIEDSLYLETDLSAAESVVYSYKMMKYAGLDKDALSIKKLKS